LLTVSSSSLSLKNPITHHEEHEKVPPKDGSASG
jgi:hypothetical protein